MTLQEDLEKVLDILNRLKRREGAIIVEGQKILNHLLILG